MSEEGEEQQQQVTKTRNSSKYTYYIYIMVCVSVMLCFVVLLCTMWNKQTVQVQSDRVSINTGNLFGAGRKNCEIDKGYCFSDEDCDQQCSVSSMSCVHGICLNKIAISDATNECDPSKGVIGYLVGNTALGTYQYICKSIDPAIAISVDENRMCFGDDTYQIDYLKTFPSIYSCTCSDKVLVPATAEKREHAECDPRYSDLVPL